MSSNQPDESFARAFRLHQQGRLREAFAAYNALLATTPAHAPALHYSGLVLHQSGHSAEALVRLERSLALDPASGDAWSNLALVYAALERPADALAALAEATRRSPRDAAVWENYSAHLLDAGRLGDAEHAARHATTLDARSPGAWYNLALVLHQQQRHADALLAIGRARALAPDAAPLTGLAAAIEEARGRPETARTILVGALQRHRDPLLRFQLAGLCERTGDLPAAATAYERLLDAADPQGAALSQLLFVRKRLADWHDLDVLRNRFRAGIAARLPLLSPFCLLSDPSSRSEQRQCAETWASAFGTKLSSETGSAQGVGTGRRIETRDRLTIGYLSADFHMHATALLTAGLFERHDRKRYHVIAYSTGPDDQSTLRKRIENAFDSFRNAHGWSSERLVSQIRDDRVDILVDLKGHTEHARMDVLARRPAPVQVSYLGYPGTTGASFMDYVIGDRIVTPIEHAADYTETIVQLPGCYQVNDQERRIATPPSRHVLGLPPDAVVICCFNQAYKINPDVFDAWAAILKRSPRAVLWLLARSNEDAVIANLRREATLRGIDASRVVFASSRPNAEYLGLYTHAQLFVDTWPYNGHTTTSDALWAGCPVVTMIGDTFAGRVAASVLTAVGLPELVARDTTEYVDIACALAADPERCAALRRYLEDRGRSSALFDVDRTTRDLENVYDTLIQQQRAGVRAPITPA